MATTGANVTPQGVSPIGRTGLKRPSGYSTFQMPQYTQEQQQLFSDQFQHVNPQSYLGRLAGGDQSAFEEQEAPAMRQFSSLLGNIGSRFSGMGLGGRKSSGFQNTVNQAGSEFAQDLASKRMEQRMKALEELMSFSDRLLGQRPYDVGFAEKPQKPSFWNSFAGGFGQGLGEGIPKAVGASFGGGG